MNKEELKKLCEELISNPPCCRELQDAGRKWIDAIGTDGEHAAAEALIKELEEDVNTIDDTIAFFSSPFAKEHIPADVAEKLLKESIAAKEAGAKWCNCPACTKGAIIMENREILLS